MAINVSLRQLRVFEAVARLSNYTRAAEELHLSQPAVSMQVHQREEGSGTRQSMERHFREAGMTIRHGMQMTRNEAVKQAVRSGLGLSVVSMHTIELELETHRLVILDVQGFPLPRKWYLVYRRGKRLSPAAAAFRDFVLREGPLIAAPASPPPGDGLNGSG